MENYGGISKLMNIKKENIVLIQEPQNKFITHVTPKTGHADKSADAILNKLEKIKIGLENLKVLGGDGCHTNTGRKGGIMRLIELSVGRPLQRSVCLLHLDEILLKKVGEHLFGSFKGPTDFSVLGKILEDCHSRPPVKFKRIIPRCFPKFNTDGLSRDQQYLFAMALAVKSGTVPKKLANLTPGPLNQARWLTLASRVLRAYVSESNPMKELVNMAAFVMKVYVPHWQLVKTKNSLSFGACHFLGLIKTTR